MFAEKLKNIKNVNSQHLTKNIKLGFLIAGIVTLILACVAKFSWFSGKSPVSLVVRNSQPAAAIFVSKSSPAMVSLLVNPDGLQTIAAKGEFSQLKFVPAIAKAVDSGIYCNAPTD